jgi:HK97 family phage major capsid protein
MKLTQKLKDWLAAECGVKPVSTDDEYKAAVAAAMAKATGEKGYLSPDKFVELTQDEDAKAGGELLAAISGLTEALKGANKGGAKEGGASPLEKALAGGTGDVRVKGAHERYDSTKSALRYPEIVGDRKHPFAGARVREGGRTLDETSELDKAIAGAFIRHSVRHCNDIPRQMRYTEHDRELLLYAAHNQKWGGVLGQPGVECEKDAGAVSFNNEKLVDKMSTDAIKAVLDDSTSGGLEVAPIVFDDQVIQIPLLYGEVFPMVNVVPITRGRRIEGASFGTVTLSSGGADGTDIPLFTTTSFISAFDTTIFGVNGAIEIGLDFLSDSPVGVSEIVVKQYAEVLMTWLDEQILLGDGTTEPEGIMNASGTTSVAFGSAAATVAKYLSLLFGVSKAYKKNTPLNRLAFAANETSYERARSIATGVTGDTRLVFGMDVEDYKLFLHPYAINEVMANTQIAFCNFARYRMYRRLGLTIKSTTEGKTLVRQNMLLITARARFGGQLEDGAACARTTTAEA